MISRNRLPNRRSAETFELEVEGLRYTATVGRFSDGTIGELFLNSQSYARYLGRGGYMSELSPEPSIPAAGADPGRRKAAAHEARRVQTFAVTSAPAATPIADMVEAMLSGGISVEVVGLALKGALITPEQALELLHDCDVLRLVGPPHEEARP